MDSIGSLTWMPAVLVALTASLLILLGHRRLLLIILAIQFGLVGWLTLPTLPLASASGKLIAGLMACAIMVLSMSSGQLSLPLLQTEARTARPFTFFAVILVVVASWGLSRTAWLAFMGLDPAASLGAHWLLFLGLLHLGLSEDPFRIGIGLLTIVSGFEVAYSTLESSLAIHALLAAVHIGIAIVVSYLVLLADTGSRSEGDAA